MPHLIVSSRFAGRLFATLLVAVLAVMLVAAPAAARIDARMFRYPDVSATQITFVYAGDIWVVAKEGGTASRLSSPPGEESFPRFSADGNRIAFSANYDGNTDVYVVDASGGSPERVTYHPGDDRLLDWSSDGESLLFASRRSSFTRVSRFFRVAASGGLPEMLPVPYGEFGALAADGRRIAYTTKAREFRHWKRYRGGMAPDIYLFDLETLEAENLTDDAASDMQPMWHGETLYFLSDRGEEQRLNLWARELAGGEFRQVTHFEDDDISWPAIGPSEIVFQAAGRLHLLDLASEEHHEVAVEVVTDLATLKPRRVDVGELLQGASISPSGKRAVVAARGEIFTLPVEHGVVRQLTHSSGVAERSPAWSPDGQHIAYWSDRSGEYELVLRDAKGGGEEEIVTELGPGFRYQPFFSPDSKRIAFIDNTQTIRVVHLETREVQRVDETLYYFHPSLRRFELSWSADSRWIAYHRHLDNGGTAIFLFDTASGERHQVTSGYYSDSAPVFDPDGNYLYYQSNRSLQPLYSDLDATWVYSNTTQLVAVALREDVASPLAPRNDEEEGDEEDKEKDEGAKSADDAGDEKKGKGKKNDKEEESEDTKKPEPLEIDLDGFEGRAVVLPPEAGNYASLRAVAGKLLFHRIPRSGSTSEEQPILFYDFEEREEKTVLDDAEGFEVSADGKKLLVALEGGFAIVDLEPGVEVEDRLPTGKLQSVVDPRQEWRQMYEDVYRTYRDNFYDPNMHGLDWEAVGEHYRTLLDDAVTRWDVNFVIGEMIGEVNASHTYVFGGDTETPLSGGAGLLGVDWTLENGVYRIARIVRGAPWDAEVRSPLAEPGVDAAEGDYVLAVNGVPIDISKDPYAAFEGLAGEAVLLTLNTKPHIEGAREVLVKTMEDDSELRHREWIEANRLRVEEATEGRVGYVYVPDTGTNGQNELVRQFTHQTSKQALIVDERWNGGGQLGDRFVELLHRRRVGHLFSRYGSPTKPWPMGTLYGPKVMLINGWAGSGGDALPWFFREMEAGSIVGERTWGGLIGPAFGHQLIDGGAYTAPPGRLYRVDGQWFAEGHGVDPDIPVLDDPGELAKGRDPQLEAGIVEVLRLLESREQHPGAPPFESRVP